VVTRRGPSAPVDGLVLIDRDGLDDGTTEQQMEPAFGEFTFAAFDDDRGFQQFEAQTASRHMRSKPAPQIPPERSAVGCQKIGS
jgi:hypothetical protein